MSIKEALTKAAERPHMTVDRFKELALNEIAADFTAHLRRALDTTHAKAHAERDALAHEVISSHEATIAQLTKREVLLTECLRETINYVAEARANRAQVAACYPDSSTARELFEKVDALAARLAAALAG